MSRLPFDEIASADLIVEQTYGSGPTIGYEPLKAMFGVGNAGGFRVRGSIKRDDVRLLVLYSSQKESDWPDQLDLELGLFRYYGDNRSPGHELHDTAKLGNLLLSRMFSSLSDPTGRASVPPVLLFFPGGSQRDMTFRGLLVPGSSTAVPDEQLVAVWRSASGQRFQNYKALFSVLDTRRVDRAWIDSILDGRRDDALAPPAYQRWIRTGIAERLIAPRTLQIRSREEQLPKPGEDAALLAEIHAHFARDPHAFEACASEIWQLIAPASDEIVQTRPSRDGGRDAVGTYRLGPGSDPIKIDYALEAKCYAPLNSVGVKETSRLISRLRHRNFGVLVTTSYVHKQAYEEIRADQHPVVIVSGRDIVETLKSHGRGTVDAIRSWLTTTYPTVTTDARLDVAYDKPVELSQPTAAAERS